MYMYIYIYVSPLINHLKITLKVLLKQKSNHLIVEIILLLPPGKKNARMYY